MVAKKFMVLPEALEYIKFLLTKKLPILEQLVSLMPTKSRESIVIIEAIAPRVATMPNRGTDLKELQELRAVKALIEAIVSKAPIESKVIMMLPELLESPYKQELEPLVFLELAESQAAMICKEANAAGSQLTKVR